MKYLFLLTIPLICSCSTMQEPDVNVTKEDNLQPFVYNPNTRSEKEAVNLVKQLNSSNNKSRSSIKVDEYNVKTVYSSMASRSNDDPLMYAVNQEMI